MKRGGFVVGLLVGWGLVGAAVVLLAWLVPAVDIAALNRWLGQQIGNAWGYVHLNLKGSIIPFFVVLMLYWLQHKRLGLLLQQEAPILSHVVRKEQSLDLCASLFFGIGVIWTAIGMRDALLFALGDRDMAAAQSAFSVLQRLVDGGILLALSTTIVGGVGGYLMRVIKSVCFGQQLTELYMAESRRAADENLNTLRRIEERIGEVGSYAGSSNSTQ